MFTLIAENQHGEQLELTHNYKYSIANIIGLDPPDAVINSTRNAGQDGSIYNSSYMSDRTITITLAVNSPAETNRIELYKYFKSKFPVILRYRNGSRSVWIQGYVQSFQVAYFDKKETVQITIVCPRPYLNDENVLHESLTNIVSLFEFPFDIEQAGEPMSDIILGQEKSIYNLGDMDTGVFIRLTAAGTVVNPQIYNTIENTYMKILDTLADGDVIEINTRSGQKSIKKISSGVVTNEIAKLAHGSTWFTLSPGDNLFSAYADSGEEYIMVEFEVIYQYEGV